MNPNPVHGDRKSPEVDLDAEDLLVYRLSTVAVEWFRPNIPDLPAGETKNKYCSYYN